MSGKKCKYTAPNGQEYECKPSIICGDCKNNNKHYIYCVKKDGYCDKRNCFDCEYIREELDKKMKAIDPNKYNVTKTGQVLKSQSPEQYEEQKKAFEDAINCNDKKIDGVYIRNYDYTKIQNYIEAIRLIAEKVGTAESDCIEQLARDVGNYLYDLVKGDKND